MSSDASVTKQIEALYEDLAQAVDAVRDGLEDDLASECEAQFLIKLSFLALREIGDPERQRDLIKLAARDLAHPHGRAT